jgi:hypothetical protein
MSKSRSQQRRNRLFFIPFEKSKSYEDLMNQVESAVSQSSVEKPILPDAVSDRPAEAAQSKRPPIVQPPTEEEKTTEEEDAGMPVTPPPQEIKPPTLVRAVRVKRNLAWGEEEQNQ